ncbi:MAG: DUF5060 domain-containing protein [Pirellulales bacterium]
MTYRSNPWQAASAFAATTALLLTTCLTAAAQEASGRISGELKRWHRITIDFEGPQTNESADPNPFRDYRLDVTFRHGDRAMRVAGFYAADGNAAESGSDSGRVWRVHFVPDQTGQWTYTASFRTGRDIALSEEPAAGDATAFDGAQGELTVAESDKSGRDHRAHGLLRYVGGHHLQFAGSERYFLKGGADSPENFLAYADFDGTSSLRDRPRRQGEAAPAALHRYEPHVRDWRQGDPTWGDGQGKGIIGALNYLADQHVNSVYFLTMNVGGDGQDVWPWADHDQRFRFDCSKLDQWEIVFSHMDCQGIMLHVVTQEQENDQLLDGGELGPQRKLYYRELVARFGHHLAVTWNLGEENTNTSEQRKAFCRYLHELDPYDHQVVVHTFPGRYDEVYEPLLGFKHFEGPSLQTNDTHEQTLRWVHRSAEAGRPWIVCLDEIGPANTGVKPDEDDPGHDEIRKRHLWGNLMGGGAGVEWYFGYNFPHNDLNLEDFRSRERMWEQTANALRFMHEHLPFQRMKPADDLTSDDDDYCLADPGSVYAIFRPDGGSTELDLGERRDRFEVRWYNPRSGGELQSGSMNTISGPGSVAIGEPPSEGDRDWVALVRRTDR